MQWSAALNMSANLENSAVATGMEKVSYHSNPKEGQCQIMLKLLTIALISLASKMMLWKCCIQYSSKFGKLSSGHRTGKGVFIPIPKKGNAKECSNYRTIALISHASKVMLKILQARLQQYMNCELLDVQAGFRKGRGTKDQIANICWIMEKAREFQKNIYFWFIE